MKLVFHLKVERAKLVTDIDFQNHLHSLEGCEVDVTVEKHRSSRSSNQNRYYWGVVIQIISDETGYSRDEMHEILRSKFLREEAEIGNDKIGYSRSTTSLKTNEFEDYMSQIRQWSSVELNCYIPEPNEVDV